MQVTVNQRHIGHKTWGTCITVVSEDGKTTKEFSLYYDVCNSTYDIRPWGDGGVWKSFDTRDEAIAGCKRRMRK